MFTGIIEDIRPVISLKRGAASARLSLDLGGLAQGVAVGDSICVSGACLTVTVLHGAAAEFDVSGESLARTTLGELTAGAPVNVERALRVGDRLGGHFVQGHVDGLGRIARRDEQEGQWVMGFEAEPGLCRSMILKGSIAVDGISLTLSALEDGYFEVTLIPHTIEKTTLRGKRRGDRVNLETDMIGKWVRKLLAGIEPGGPGLSLEQLEREGFV